MCPTWLALAIVDVVSLQDASTYFHSGNEKYSEEDYDGAIADIAKAAELKALEKGK